MARSDLSRLGLGLAAVARPAYITSGRAADLGDARGVEQLRDRTRELLDAAYAHGLRYLDVARSYGRAEEFLAGWLADHPEVSDVEIGSKWGYRYVGDWRVDADVHEIKDHSLPAFTEQSAQSLDLLGDRLGIYHVHSATLETGVLDDTGVHRAMAGLRERGIRLGISTSGPRQPEAIRRALDVRVDGEPLFTSFQSTWNALEPSAGPALAEAADSGARVIVKEAFANGRLAPGGDDGTAAARAAADLADRLDVPLDRLAVAAVLTRPWAGHVLLGPVGTAQLASNVAAVDVVLPDGIDDELDALAEPAQQYWATRSGRPWS
ncbi:aryl-alcohol dehydrogenase-like predicted oxidoreductase [Pseudonocardia sediminis]|uniref:Aryl-alcohol dehydrogenase-like predicted oxidoreductase n=1 Tax=Pseudonocardia sediminis TaxID=1397368 RepID=A0A4Q7V324_PSEST|nr:aldo/keto reductase [Pseudonocardia sediminis]RZT88997.1 aryl-alcohol dehydrogenase-like predicted oxidoreductase [Pseudonocardia sediminis]